MKPKPLWLREFEEEVKKARKKSRAKSKQRWYFKWPQSNQEVIRKIGRGDCVAWSLLAKKIALRHNCRVFLITTGNKRRKRNWSWHQWSYIIGKDRIVYRQSLIWVGNVGPLRSGGRLTVAKVVKFIRNNQRYSRDLWNWKTIPVIEELIYYCTGKKPVKLMKCGKLLKK